MIPENEEQAAKLAAEEMRLAKLRYQIDSTAGPASREGVMADVLAYFVNAQAAAAVAVAKASTIADIKAAFAEQAAIGQQLLELQASGALIFPYRAKGLDGAGILADLVRVSNGVSAALGAVTPLAAPAHTA